MLNVVMLSGIILNVVMLSGIILNFVMLSGIILNVVAPYYSNSDHFAPRLLSDAATFAPMTFVRITFNLIRTKLGILTKGSRFFRKMSLDQIAFEQKLLQ